MRIILIISSLGSGGAERVITGLANYLDRNGYDVTLITYIKETVDFYKVSSSIHRIRLNLGGVPNNNFHALFNLYYRVTNLRKAILKSKPDQIISFIDRCNILTLLACQHTRIPIIISERTNPIYYPIGRFWALLRRLVYRRADYLVVQTESLLNWAQTYIDIDHISVIPNALDDNRIHVIQESQKIEIDRPWKKSIIAMGRFTSEKGHDLLLKSVFPLLKKETDWGLEIIGDGPLRPKLTQLIQDLGLQDKVLLHGQVQNPFSILKSADIFVLPSRIEGFPNALLEAMALGLACISFNCPSGPSDLIEHNHNGLLVEKENVDALTAAIEECMTSKKLRLRLGQQAMAVVDQYSESNVMPLWEALLNT